jgi:flavodoxin I
MIMTVVKMLALLAAADAYVVGPTVSRSMGRVRASSLDMKVGLIYSTTTGNTETVAGYVEAATGATMTDIGDCSPDDLMAFDGLICGAPTWHTGADTERSGTAWDDFLYGDLTSMDLKGKKVAVFGLGDQAGYGDNFCDAMDELTACFKAQGAEIVGSWSTDGYDHDESKSVDGGKFVGLPCDEDNQPEMSEERVNSWVEQLKGEGMAI